MDHSVPYMITNTGIAYLKSKVKDFEPSWAMFDRADLKGRMVMLNDMRETIGAALKFLGYSLNTRNEEELAKARDVVLGWKKNLAKFENEQYKSGLASGEFLLVHGYSGDILQVQAENPDVAFAMPREGGHDLLRRPGHPQDGQGRRRWPTPSSTSCTSPQVAAENTDFTQYLCPNKDAYAAAVRRHQEQSGHLPGPGDQGQVRSPGRPGRRQRQVGQGLGRDQGRQVGAAAEGSGPVRRRSCARLRKLIEFRA